MSAHRHTSTLELLQGGRAAHSLALAGGVALHAINVYIATTIMPSVVASIGGLSYYAWNTTLFVVASILGSALAYAWMDKLGPRHAYLAALVIFLSGMVLCGSAVSMPMLLLGRTVQGLAGGLLMALSYAMIRIVYEPRLWPSALAFVSAMWGIATLSGPALGGFFAGLGQWRLAFWCLCPLVPVIALLVIRKVPKTLSNAGPAVGVSIPKLLLLTLAVMTISVASLSNQTLVNAGGLVLGLMLVAVVMRMDVRGPLPLLPTGAYRVRSRMGASFFTMAALIFGLTAEIFVPYFLQVIHQVHPMTAGYLTATMSGGWTLAALLFSGRQGAQADRQIRLGPTIVGGSLLALAVLMPMPALNTHWLGWTGLILSLAGVGFGVGFCWAHLASRVFSQAPAGQENLTSASVITVQLVAMAVGAAFAGVVVNAAGMVEPGGVEGAVQAARWLFLAFAVLPLLGIRTARDAARAAPKG